MLANSGDPILKSLSVIIMYGAKLAKFHVGGSGESSYGNAQSIKDEIDIAVKELMPKK